MVTHLLFNIVLHQSKAKIKAVDDKAQTECFGITWEGPKKQKKAKKRSGKETKTLFKEQYEKLDELIEVSSNYKDVNTKMWKIKELLCGSKVGPTEPACINDPVTKELITDIDTIKQVSLEHCCKILTKNEIRECDKQELKGKEDLHKEVMNRDTKDEYDLDIKMYYKVLKRISRKGKRMFDLLNKAGDKYKEAIYWYMKRIFKNENTPF